jgi:hypothetical protein
MLKDRRVLLDQEIAKLTSTCGQMYIDAMRQTPTDDNLNEYHSLIEKLSNMKTELGIISEMINQGHE